MSAFTSQQPKCPTCGADAWKSTKHCPFCGTVLWNEDGSAVSPALTETDETLTEEQTLVVEEQPIDAIEPDDTVSQPLEDDTDDSELFKSEGYSFRSEVETQDIKKYDIPDEPESSTAQVAPLVSETPVAQVEPYVPKTSLASVKPVEQPSQKNVQPPVDIVSSVNPSTDATVGIIFFLIIWVIIGFNVIISFREPGFFVFGLAFFGIGGWLMVKKIRNNRNKISEVKKGHIYEAVVLEHLEVKENTSSGNSRGNTTTYKMRVRTYIYGRETRILLIVKNKNAKFLYPKGSKVRIVGDGYMWLLQDDVA